MRKLENKPQWGGGVKRTAEEQLPVIVFSFPAKPPTVRVLWAFSVHVQSLSTSTISVLQVFTARNTKSTLEHCSLCTISVYVSPALAFSHRAQCYVKRLLSENTPHRATSNGQHTACYNYSACNGFDSQYWTTPAVIFSLWHSQQKNCCIMTLTFYYENYYILYTV